MKKGKRGEELTHDIDSISWTGETFGVVLDNIGGPEDTLDGAGFDVELIVAEAISPVYSWISSSTPSNYIQGEF